jgi:predicted nucleotidyltransferase
MDRPAIVEILRRYDAALRENGATGFFIFGSRARGTHRPDSDLDLFVDYNTESEYVPSHATRGRDFRGSRHPVTITTRNALHPLVKDKIERDAVQVL